MNWSKVFLTALILSILYVFTKPIVEERVTRDDTNVITDSVYVMMANGLRAEVEYRAIPHPGGYLKTRRLLHVATRLHMLDVIPDTLSTTKGITLGVWQRIESFLISYEVITIKSNWIARREVYYRIIWDRKGRYTEERSRKPERIESYNILRGKPI